MSTSGDRETSLLEYLDITQLNCLNESSEHTLISIVGQRRKNTSNDNYLLSDADEQLLLNLPFNQVVRVREIVIQCSIIEQAPKDVKITPNRQNLGFEDMEDAIEPEVAQELMVKESDVKEGRPIALRYVRFQTVNSLHVFVGSNQGGKEQTRIDSIDVLGVPVETTKELAGLKSSSG